MRKCGFHNCRNKIEKKDGHAWETRCNVHLNRGWAPKCDSCSLTNAEERKFSIIYDFSDAVTGENKIKEAKENVKKILIIKKKLFKSSYRKTFLLNFAKS